MRFVLILLAVAISFESLSEDRRTDTSRLTVMTYNTYFMWDGLAPEDCKTNRAIKFLPWFNDPQKAAVHMAEIADVIKNNNPDIVSLVEIEGFDALQKLNTTYLKGMGYKVYMKDDNHRGICQDVGILTRIDPIEINRDKSRRKNSEDKTKGVRKNYYATFEINNHKIALIGGHFKAHPTVEANREYRNIQATILSDRADKLREEGFLPIILGDFNDFDSKTYDRNSNETITRTLKILRGDNTKTHSDDMFNVANLISHSDRYTAAWDEDGDGLFEFFDPDELSSLDHLLIDKMLMPFVENAYIDHTAPLKKTLDHRPVVVVFAF